MLQTSGGLSEVGAAFGAVVAGAMTWSLLEYALHRWAGHLPKGRIEVSREHLAHHADARYFTPWVKKSLLAVPAVCLAVLAGWQLAGAALGALYGVGFAGAWLGYELLHRRIHTHAPLNAWGAWARRHHLQHHYGNPNLNHGVTSPLWDHIFGTMQPSVKVRIPVRKAEGWMLDAATGRLSQRFVDTYELVGRPPLKPSPQP